MVMMLLCLLCQRVQCGHCAAQPRTETIDLESDNSLRIEISDALSEQEKVKFTIHTKVPVCRSSGSYSRVVLDRLTGGWGGVECHCCLTPPPDHSHCVQKV